MAAMTARPHPDRMRRRFGWLILLVAALLSQMAAPQGWMPVVASNGAVTIAPCDGMGPAAAMAMMMPGGDKSHHKAPHQGPIDNHPCAAAGLAIANAPPPPPQIAMAPASPIDTPVVAEIDALPGRGLAAPPPPATGPPTRA